MKHKMAEKLTKQLSSEGGGYRLRVMLTAGYKLISSGVNVIQLYK